VKGNVQVQWAQQAGFRKMAAEAGEKGRVSKKGLLVRLADGRLTATTRGLARDVEICPEMILSIHDSFAAQGKATLVVEESVTSKQKLTSHVLLSKADPVQLAGLLDCLRRARRPSSGEGPALVEEEGRRVDSGSAGGATEVPVIA